ncbi:MAG: hypothetical protein GC160_24395 [Acidobacteria bacterium]|nr:hypothetical protein [Acidobacteriota bacterium]
MNAVKIISLALGFLLAVAVPGAAQERSVRIGVALDGPWDRNEDLLQTFERETVALLRESGVSFPPDKRIEADWTAAGVAGVIDRLLEDPDVDYILALGVLSSNDAARRPVLGKPVIAPFVLDPELQEIPSQVRQSGGPAGAGERIHVSGVENLSYATLGVHVLEDVSAFRELTQFSKLTILSMQALAEASPRLAANVRKQLEPLGLDITTVRVRASVEEALAQIPSDAEAVYITPLFQLSNADFDRLSEGLIERRLPTFSLWGRSEVARGVLATLAIDLDLDRLARRVALNVHRIVRGDRAEDLPVDFQRDKRLTINMATARAIGFYPSWALLTEADLLNEARTGAGRTLSLAHVIREAGEVNLDLAAANRTVAAGLQSVREARARLRPQVSVSGLGSFIDRDRAEAGLGRQGQAQTAGSLGVSQLIYSENVRAGYDIEKQLQTTREQDRAQLRLDVILQAAESYLNVLRAKTAEEIQRSNLRLTRNNLDLAKARRDIGYSGPGEVFRWESQIADNRRGVIDASAQRNLSEIEVNRVLNRPLEQSFLTQEASLGDPELLVSFERLRPYIDNPQSFRVFRQFMSREALEGSPELRQLDASIRAQERALLAAKRAFYVPTIGVSADLTGFKNGGPGSSAPSLPGGLAQEDFLTTPNALNWTVGASATLPLFQGGALRAQRTRAEIQLDEWTVQREAARQRVEQRIRSALHQAQASFAGIGLAQDAAGAARSNLDLVTDSYSQGVVDIVRVLDAQSQSLVADLAAANAVYDFLIDLMNVERAVGRFDYYRSAEDQETFLKRLADFYRDAGFDIRP